jgi:hypothetical protein
LVKRGVNSVSSSNTRKVIQVFEQNEQSEEIFRTLCERPFLRILMHLVAQQSLPITKDQIQQMLWECRERLKQVLKISTEKNLLCRNCAEIIQRYNIYDENRPTWKIRCPKCNAPNELSQSKEENDWSFPIISVTSYLDQLVKAGILTSKVLGNCTRCMRSEAFDQLPLKTLDSLSAQELRVYVKRIYCKQCGKLYDFTELYDLSELMSPLWSMNGTWLEWYVKNILANAYANCPVEQGIVVKRQEAVEVDVILLRNEKIVTFECKGLSTRRNASFNDVSEVLKLLDFSDQVFLVTTTTLKENDKKSLLKMGNGKMKVIEGYGIEQIREKIEG